MSTRKDRLVWLDLETSTSDETDPRAALLELGLTVTDISGRIISENNWVMRLTEADRSSIGVWDEVVLKMHASNDLLFECLKSELNYAAFWTQVQGTMDSQKFTDDPDHPRPKDEIWMMAGSGLHYDRRYLKQMAPDWFLKRFTYYNIDVGVMRRMLQMHMSNVPIIEEKSLHRALDCNRDSIAWYIKVIGMLKHADAWIEQSKQR